MKCFNLLIRKTRLTILVCIYLLTTTHLAQAQQEERAILAVIDQLFEGMRAGDSTKVRAVFHQEARLMTAMMKEGAPILHLGSTDEFVKAVGTPREEVWDEQVLSSSVKIDGNLATVWTDYSFYVGEKFSHCGVNAFQLFSGNDGWKIIQITDTRRKENCIKK